MSNRLQSEHLGRTEWSGSGAKIQRRKRKSDWMNTPMKFDLTTYLCFIGILALHLRDSTYLSSEATDVSKNISDLTQAMIGESSQPFLTLKKTNIIRNPWLAMLLLAGDVQSNPGPGRSYPCTVCQRNVRNQDASVSCDQCNGWSHTVCVGISDAEYDTLMEQGSFDLFCHKCTLAELPSYPSSPERELNDTDSTIDTDNFRNTGNALRIVNINVNSIKSTDKIVLFHAFLDDVNPDIVIGTESKLDSTYKNCEIFPPGYRNNVIRRDRNHHGGGVFIIAKDEINITEIDIANTDCPLVLAKIMVKDEANIAIGAFYRQPSRDITENDDLMTTLLSIQNGNRATELIGGGDFNLPGIIWGDNVTIKDTPSYLSQVNERLIELCDTLGLTQVVQQPTRENNIMDLFLVTSPDRCTEADILTGISDHDAVCLSYNRRVNRNKKSSRKVYLFKRADMESLK